MSTVNVTAAMVAAAELKVKRLTLRGEIPSSALLAIALAKPSVPKKVSTNMIHARELDITAVTTVSELFELIDLPHRITKHAQLSVVRNPLSPFEGAMGTATLRLEWRGEGE